MPASLTLVLTPNLGPVRESQIRSPKPIPWMTRACLGSPSRLSHDDSLPPGTPEAFRVFHHNVSPVSCLSLSLCRTHVMVASSPHGANSGYTASVCSRLGGLHDSHSGDNGRFRHVRLGQALPALGQGAFPRALLHPTDPSDKLEEVWPM